MPEIGLPGTATYATTYTSIEEILTNLPDNTGNEIDAQKMRNVIYTLFSLQNNNNLEFFYTNSDTITNYVGNWRLPNSRGWGGTFSNVSLKELFDGIFYLDAPPTGLISFNPDRGKQDYKGSGTTQYIQQLASAGLPASVSTSGYDELCTFTLKWTATKKTYPLQLTGSITRDPASVPPEQTPLITIPILPTGKSDETMTLRPRINQTNKYTLNFKDERGNSVVGPPSVSVEYSHRYYWGKVANKNPFTTSSQIRALDGAGVSGSGEFADKIARFFNGIDGAGQYLCWAFPSSWGTPKFFVNTRENNAFTKINDKFPYINIYGYREDYDVWVTNTAQNASIDTFQIVKV
jgi:hypothetical protein